MIYEFSCTKCRKHATIGIPIKLYDELKKEVLCCGQQMEPVITGGLGAFLREPFPRGYEITEHAVDEPVYCKDKAQLRDICEESGTTSRFLEDDM